MLVTSTQAVERTLYATMKALEDKYVELLTCTDPALLESVRRAITSLIDAVLEELQAFLALLRDDAHTQAHERLHHGRRLGNRLQEHLKARCDMLENIYSKLVMRLQSRLSQQNGTPLDRGEAMGIADQMLRDGVYHNGTREVVEDLVEVLREGKNSLTAVEQFVTYFVALVHSVDEGEADQINRVAQRSNRITVVSVPSPGAGVDSVAHAAKRRWWWYVLTVTIIVLVVVVIVLISILTAM
jgi:hypothetical protein